MAVPLLRFAKPGALMTLKAAVELYEVRFSAILLERQQLAHQLLVLSCSSPDRKSLTCPLDFLFEVHIQRVMRYV